MKKTTLLRRLMERSEATLLCGVHDGISARVAEEAKFDGIWASGFCISASKGIPDVGLVTMTEHLAATTEINKCTSLPVVADVDNGYGDAINVTRVVNDYEAAGIAAICMEDYHHPKRCSLISGLRRRLETSEEFSLKILAAKDSQKDPDFVVIARTEALVAEEGTEEALRRASLYAKAGADLILVQSKEPSGDQIKAFGERWNGPVPLVAVPTMYPTVTVEELYGLGYAVVIFANQGFRASILAMKQVFREMVETRTLSSVEEKISPLKEVFSLVGYDRIQMLEDRFVAPSLKIGREEK